MEDPRNILCLYCSSKFGSAAFWDPPAGSNEQRSGYIGSRHFGDIKTSEACSMCNLICAALVWKDGTFPAVDKTIYYSQVLYGRYSLQSSHTQIATSSGLDAHCLSIKKTYRLRVSTKFQYDSLPGMDERFFQDRAYDQPGPREHEGDIMLLKNECSPGGLFHGRELSEKLNIGLLTRWVSTHFNECKPKGESHIQGAAETPLRVIDTRRLVVRQTPPGCQYVALSYTWGPECISQLRLTKSNELQLTCLGLKDIWETIPRTIRDAICLCRELKIDYLWVDALCRGQGDDYEDEKAIENIGRIFAKACLTIVGNGENSHSGLAGVRLSGSPHRRQVRQLVGDLDLAVAKPLIDESMIDSAWMKRIWTYDEKNVSRHLLVLADDQAFFYCTAKKMIYSEDTYSEVALNISEVSTPELDEFWSFYEGWDGGFDVYASEAEHYAYRHVTKENDLSSGFAAVKWRLIDRLGSKYHWDLPMKYFTQALCFAIYAGGRRSSAKFPSWSWQGWNASNFCYESMWGFDPTETGAAYFHRTNSLAQGDYQFEPICQRLENRREDLPLGYCDDHSLCPDVIAILPDVLKKHLLAFEAFTFELFLERCGEKWSVALQNGGSEIGEAFLILPDEQIIKGHFKLVYIGLCCPEREGDDYEFLLVLASSGYDNVFRRVGCCLYLDAVPLKGRGNRETIYLI